MTFLEFVIRIWFYAFMCEQGAMRRANRAGGPEWRNIEIQVSNFGRAFVLMGAMNAVVMITALTELPESISSWPLHLCVMFLVILGISFISGLVVIAIGLFLLSTNNPGGQHILLALLVLCASCVVASCAIAILAGGWF